LDVTVPSTMPFDTTRVRTAQKELYMSHYSTFRGDYPYKLNGRSVGAPIEGLGDVHTAAHILPSFDFSYLKPINDSLAISIAGSQILRYIHNDTFFPEWDLNTGIQSASRYRVVPQVATIKDTVSYRPITLWPPVEFPTQVDSLAATATKGAMAGAVASKVSPANRLARNGHYLPGYPKVRLLLRMNHAASDTTQVSAYTVIVR